MGIELCYSSLVFGGSLESLVVFVLCISCYLWSLLRSCLFKYVPICSSWSVMFVSHGLYRSFVLAAFHIPMFTVSPAFHNNMSNISAADSMRHVQRFSRRQRSRNHWGSLVSGVLITALTSIWMIGQKYMVVHIVFSSHAISAALFEEPKRCKETKEDGRGLWGTWVIGYTSVNT